MTNEFRVLGHWALNPKPWGGMGQGLQPNARASMQLQGPHGILTGLHGARASPPLVTRVQSRKVMIGVLFHRVLLSFVCRLFKLNFVLQRAKEALKKKSLNPKPRNCKCYLHWPIWIPGE